MQRIFLALGQAFRKSILIVAMLSLLSLSSLFIFGEQPSLAAISTESQKLIQQENMDKDSGVANQREQDYEEQVKAAADPDKVFEENAKEYKAENPDSAIDKTIEGAENLIDEVTGKE